MLEVEDDEDWLVADTTEDDDDNTRYIYIYCNCVDGSEGAHLIN